MVVAVRRHTMRKHNVYAMLYRAMLFIILILAIAFLYSLYPFVKSYIDARAVQDTYIIEENVADIEVAEDESGVKEIDAEKYPFLKNFEPLTIDHTALKNINADYIGWIDIPGTEVSYPVFYSKDNENYMHTDALTGKYKYAGSIFADKNYDATARNVNLYGHNMKIGTMFSRLNKYGNKSFYDEHPYFVFYPYGSETYEIYQIFSCFVLPGNDPDGIIQKYHFDTDADFSEFVTDISKRSIYDMGVTGDIPDKVMTLCTCHGKHANDQRFVVMGKILTDLYKGAA